jgi:carboxyl-terminal processing protease
MQVKKSFLMPAVVGLVAVMSGGWLLQQGTQESAQVKARALQDVIRVLSERYVEQLDATQLYDMAIEGLLEQLGDPHTVILGPEDYAALRLTTTGNYGGLGIRIDKKDEWITVVQTLPNTPADRAGLRPGDRLIEVDGKSMYDWSADEAVRVLRGPKGAPVDIKIERVGVPEPIPVHIVRDEIHVNYVTGFMYEPGIGYIRHEQFSARSAEEIRAGIEELRRQGLRGLILDLRSNPGGLLEEGVAVSDLFLRSGSDVVETRSRLAEQNETYRAKDRPVDVNLPVVVLVDGFSASASEIVAGALQDHDRALVVGTSTFGKGSVQTLYPLAGGSYLKVTTARWYTPSGRSIERESVEPQELAQADQADEQAAAREVYRTEGGRDVYGGGGITPDLVVRGDTLFTVEQEFRAALGSQLAAYSDAVFRFAAEYANDHPALGSDFQVTQQVIDEFYAWLASNGIRPERTLYDGSQRLVAHEIGVQLATIKFGDEAALRRRLSLDRQFETAVELLRQGRTQQQLFSLAAARKGDDEARQP